MKTTITPSGRKVRGNLFGQLEKIAWEMSNHKKFGLKIAKILSFSPEYTKANNPYLRSWASLSKFLQVNRQLIAHVRAEFPEIKNIWDIKSEHVQSYVENWMVGKYGFAKQTLKQHSAQIGKLERGMKYIWGYNEVSFGNKELMSGRWLANEIAKKIKEGPSRFAYKDPTALISSLKDNHSLFAQAQREGGFRFSELQYIRLKNLKGLTTDKITGEEKGVIHVKGKGGFERDCFVSQETYQKIESIISISKQKAFKVDYDAYLGNLRQSAEKTNQDYESNHGLRYNFAQERYNEYLKADYSHEDALQDVSEEMGHHRVDITEHYLGL